MLSHKNIAENLIGMCSMVYIDEKDIFLSVLPFIIPMNAPVVFVPIIQRFYHRYCEGLRHIVKNLKESKANDIGSSLIFESCTVK